MASAGATTFLVTKEHQRWMKEGGVAHREECWIREKLATEREEGKWRCCALLKDSHNGFGSKVGGVRKKNLCGPPPRASWFVCASKTGKRSERPKKEKEGIERNNEDPRVSLNKAPQPRLPTAAPHATWVHEPVWDPPCCTCPPPRIPSQFAGMFVRYSSKLSLKLGVINNH
ncbi:hypothetical protein PIB30_009809 [Stylosanthes scabra]|uniref:Uncharacterized protein n=1 Tax=Stylosanthes scabra TaxID=79078 RepID=A0ABU6Y745_9FABA|nr:hypothetical protein [Stylosanthes scabra]